MWEYYKENYEVKKTVDSDDKVNYWFYAPGEDSFKWEEYYREGKMVIGWGDIEFDN